MRPIHYFPFSFFFRCKGRMCASKSLNEMTLHGRHTIRYIDATIECVNYQLTQNPYKYSLASLMSTPFYLTNAFSSIFLSLSLFPSSSLSPYLYFSLPTSPPNLPPPSPSLFIARCLRCYDCHWYSVLASTSPNVSTFAVSFEFYYAFVFICLSFAHNSTVYFTFGLFVSSR